MSTQDNLANSFKSLRFSPEERLNRADNEICKGNPDRAVFRPLLTFSNAPTAEGSPQLWPAGRRRFLRGAESRPGRGSVGRWDNTGGVVTGLSFTEYAVCRAATHSYGTPGQRRRYTSLSVGMNRVRGLSGALGWLFPWLVPFEGKGPGRPQGGKALMPLGMMASYYDVQGLMTTTAVGLFERLVQPSSGTLEPTVGPGTQDPFVTLRLLYDFGWRLWLPQAAPDWCQYAPAVPAGLAFVEDTWLSDVSLLFNGDSDQGKEHPLDPRSDVIRQLKDQDVRGAAFFGACYAAVSVLLWVSMVCRWAGRRVPQLGALYGHLAPLPAWLVLAVDGVDMALDCRERLDQVMADRT